jgi:Transposase, Mutator family
MKDVTPGNVRQFLLTRYCEVIGARSGGAGVDLEGNKHVLGLGYGASENSTVVKALLEDLVSRGLDTTRSLRKSWWR